MTNNDDPHQLQNTHQLINHKYSDTSRMITMDPVFIPESFKDRPYAREQFKNIVMWVLNNHPLYKQWYKSPTQEIPLLTRNMILENNSKLLNGHPESGRTSGSTGIPVKFSWSEERRLIQHRDSKLYIGNWLGGVQTRSRIIRSRGNTRNDTLDISASIDEQISFIQNRHHNHNATAVITYPTNAAELCKGIIDNNIDMSYIKRFGCYAEVYEDWHEALINQAFPNAQTWTTYSATELGMIAARCPHNPKFHHVFAQKLGVEILNDDDKPCKEGELGRVVITDYFNKNSPFIRYDIGDMAEPANCPCGKISLPAITNIAGKVRGLLKKSNGEKVMFSHLDASLRDIPGMKQFQVIQEHLKQFTLRYLADDDLNINTFKSAVSGLFHEQFGINIKIKFQKESIIERGANGKFYASICKI